MSAENRLPDYLNQMVQAATKVLTYTEGIDKKSFLNDGRTQDAVAMQLVRIGEAAGRIIAGFPDFIQENQNIF